MDWRMIDFEYVVIAWLSALCIVCAIAIVYLAEHQLPENFQCTESSIVNGAAECVKYERRVEK